MECEFCKNILKTLSSLNYHKQNNKNCLSIQSSKNYGVKSSLISCKFCEKKFSTSNINKHISICKKKKNNLEEQTDDENNKMKEYIIKLETENNKMKEYIIKLETENNIYKKDHETVTIMAKQPKTNNNNNNYNLSVYDDNIIKNRFSMAINNIKPSDLYDGQKSIGRFVAPCLKNEDGSKMIYCSDPSRNVFVYKDSHGNINKDIKCKNLASIIEPIATAKVDELLDEDFEKVRKKNRFLEIKKKIISREKDIDNLENHIKGFKENTDSWYNVKNRIFQKHKENELDIIEMENLQRNFNENEYNNECYDDRLSNAADDIKDMTKDSSKFSKTISELV